MTASMSCWHTDSASKENLHFGDQSKEVVFPFFIIWYWFLKEIENMFSMFLSSYRNTRESLGELKKAVETLTISQSPKLPLMFL